MAKIMALDVGDAWVGSALSDGTQTLARPYQTVALAELTVFLEKLFTEESIEAVIVGYPKTMKGTESDQTRKIVAQKEALEKQFPLVKWILWDERLSSKRAASLGQTRSKEEKLQSHSKAAAFILDSYLSFLHIQKSLND